MRRIFVIIAGLTVVAGYFLYGSGVFKNDENKLMADSHPAFDQEIKTVFDTKSIRAMRGTHAHVSRVIDGDTVELSNGERLRYIGIDTPEVASAKKSAQCFAAEGTQRNKELVEDKDIIFYNDISPRDIYGRLLGFVYLPDGTFVNNALVNEGYAFAYSYKPDISQAQEFKNAETVARENNLGLWAACTVTSSGTGRERTNSMR